MRCSVYRLNILSIVKPIGRLTLVCSVSLSVIACDSLVQCIHYLHQESIRQEVEGETTTENIMH